MDSVAIIIYNAALTNQQVFGRIHRIHTRSEYIQTSSVQDFRRGSHPSSLARGMFIMYNVSNLMFLLLDFFIKTLIVRHTYTVEVDRMLSSHDVVEISTFDSVDLNDSRKLTRVLVASYVRRCCEEDDCLLTTTRYLIPITSASGI